MKAAYLPSNSKSSDERDTIKVLMVDDDPSYLDLCSRLLARSTVVNFKIDLAANITDAFYKCKTHDYDCLLVDYKLPDGRGTDIIDLLNEYIEQKQYQDRVPPPTIIVTADGGQHAATQAIRAGAEDFIAKRHVTTQSVRRAVVHAVEKSRLETSVKQRSFALEQANELLESANRQLESNRREILNFYHTLSHEVKTPLAAAREFISLVKDGAAGEVKEEQKELLEYAMESCDHIKHQFTDLLQLTRMDSGKVQLNLQSVLVQNIISRCVASVSESLRDKGIELHVSEIDPTLTVHCDNDRIVQVISNLLTNAVRFTDTGGTITLSIKSMDSEHQVQVIVADTGRGISEENLEHIFERLYQVDSSNTDASQTGLGLGLSICRELLRLHDCVLHVESKLGVGSQFFFNLPQFKTEALLNEAEAA